ncbi:MAG: ACT domain-containing protein [Parachlamydiaceae bacterium]|nr:ACT domain-containing protein [Parachlamydiaceae bacterium]
MPIIHPQTLFLLNETFAICRMDKGTALPKWAQSEPFYSITATQEELSIVCSVEPIPSDIHADRGWRCFKLQGPFEFSLTGILNSITIPLADANIGIFAISTYDTDYVLVKEHNRQQAIDALQKAGHTLLLI